MEAIRALMVARRSAADERTRTINQNPVPARPGPDDLRAGLPRHTAAALVTAPGVTAARPGDITTWLVLLILW